MQCLPENIFRGLLNFSQKKEVEYLSVFQDNHTRKIRHHNESNQDENISHIVDQSAKIKPEKKIKHKISDNKRRKNRDKRRRRKKKDIKKEILITEIAKIK